MNIYIIVLLYMYSYLFVRVVLNIKNIATQKLHVARSGPCKNRSKEESTELIQIIDDKKKID